MTDFFRGKKILVTGNTGFKGCWMSEILCLLGAEVIGVALPPDTNPNMYEAIHLENIVEQVFLDIRKFDTLLQVFNRTKPDMVFHLAAQPIVLDSYDDPRYTYDVNVMGTVNVCECVRKTESVKSFVNVTTDKVYKNNEWEYSYRENDALDGYDPYSNSKSCSELVTASFFRSFFRNMDVAVSTCRAGNVIGGGDFSNHRIIPDCYRYASVGKTIEVRNPNSIRPYQHVLEAIVFYLLVAEKQMCNRALEGAYNVGPDFHDCIKTSDLCDHFCKFWGNGADWSCVGSGAQHEANLLRLDTSKAKALLGWEPKWNIEKAIHKTAEWYKAFDEGEDMAEITRRQVEEYLEDFKEL